MVVAARGVAQYRFECPPRTGKVATHEQEDAVLALRLGRRVPGDDGFECGAGLADAGAASASA